MTADPAGPSTTSVIPEWTFGDRVRKIRRALNFTQEELADAIGESKKTLAAWELDTTTPRQPVVVARRLEALSGVPASWILGLDVPLPSAGAPRQIQPRRNRSRDGYEGVKAWSLRSTRHLFVLPGDQTATAVAQLSAA